VSPSFNRDWHSSAANCPLIFLPPFIVLYRLHN
jgi:hypothetical protein